MTKCDFLEFFRKSAGSDACHEELVTSLNAANFTVYQCPHIEIKHVGYCELEELESKWRRNLRLIEMELEEDPNDHVSLLHKAHLSLKLDIEDGLGLLFERALATFPPTDARIVLLCHDYSNWLLEKTKLAEAVAVSKHALASFPKHPITLTDLADLYWQSGNYAMAEASLRAIEFPPETGWAMGFSDEHLAMHARNNLAVLMRNQRRHQDAEQIWRNLLAYDAKFSPAIQGLGELFVILGRLDEAEALVAPLAATAPSNQESSILLTRVLLRRSQYENARELINKLGRTDIRVRLLFAELCIATNDIHAAKREFLDILSGRASACGSSIWTGLDCPEPRRLLSRWP